jgi:hypothetical protein
VDGKPQLLLKLASEIGGTPRLPTLCAAHVQRQTEHNLGNLVFLNQRRKVLEIGAFALALERLESLCGETERIADGKPDASGA